MLNSKRHKKAYSEGIEARKNNDSKNPYSYGGMELMVYASLFSKGWDYQDKKIKK